jgi:PAS domain S-box-containing protein
MIKITPENYEKLDVTSPQSTNHKIFHQMLISVAVTFTIYCFYYNFKKVYAPSFVMALGVMVLCPLTYYLNKSGKNNLARLTLLMTGHFYIFLTSLIFNHQINNDVYAAPAFLMGMVFFDIKNKNYFITSLILPFITWGSIKFTPFIQWPYPLELSNFNLEHLNHLNFFGSAGMTLAFVTIMMRSSREKDYRIQIELEAQKKVKAALDEKTKSDEELKKANKQLNEFFQTSPDLMGIGRPDGHFKAVNPSFCRVLGYSEHELLNRPFMSLVHPDDIAKSKETVKKIIRGEPILNFENRCRCKDGSYKTISWSCQHTQGMTTIYGIGRDMSDLIRSRNEKELLREQLEEAQITADIGSWNYHVANGQIQWSKQLFRQLGESPDRLNPTFERFSEKIHHEDKSLFIDNFKQCLNQWHSCSARVRITANGAIHWVETTMHSVTDSSGKVIEVSGTVQNITDLITKENEIQERQRFLEVILENIPSTIFVKDKKRNFAYSMINKTGAKFFNIPIQEVIGKNDFQLFQGKIAEEFHEADLETINLDGQIRNQTDVLETQDGQKTIVTQKIAIHDENGEPRYVMGIANDITNEIATKEALELERAKSIQSSKMATLGELAASIAHEINNPLSIIHGSAILIPRFIDNPEKFNQKVDNVLKAAERISKIVTGLRKFSRASVKTLNQSHSLAEIIRESIILTENKAKRNFVTVSLESHTDALIECNDIEIEQIIINMINNGIDATKELDDKWVKLSISEDQDGATLIITDSGKGIPTDVAEKMFNPFFTTKPVGEGTGLGLSIVKGIIEEHRGSIRIVPDVEHTCFEIKFKKSGASSHAA